MAILVRWLEKLKILQLRLLLLIQFRMNKVLLKQKIYSTPHKRNPTMKGFHRLMTYQLEAMHDDKAAEVSLLRSLVENQMAKVKASLSL